MGGPPTWWHEAIGICFATWGHEALVVSSPCWMALCSSSCPACIVDLSVHLCSGHQWSDLGSHVHVMRLYIYVRMYIDVRIHLYIVNVHSHASWHASWHKAIKNE